MDDLGIKIFGIILGAIIIFSLQAFGVNKLVANVFGGISGAVSEEILKTNPTEEIDFWNVTDDCGSIKCYEIYLEKYPKGKYIEIAKEKIRIKTPKPFIEGEKDKKPSEETRETAEIDFWKITEACEKIECYQSYLKKYPNGIFVDLVVEKILKTKSIKKIYKNNNDIYTSNAKVYDPKSNIRKRPKGEIICSVRTVKYIKVSRNPVQDNKGSLWYATNECGQLGYINGSQIRFDVEDFSQVSKSRIKIVKTSVKTKIYYGKWKSEEIKVYIKWDNYSKNAGISGVIETLDGRIIETFTGNNYAHRKIKIFLGTGAIIKLEADVKGDIKKWTSFNMNFSRKYK